MGPKPRLGGTPSGRKSSHTPAMWIPIRGRGSRQRAGQPASHPIQQANQQASVTKVDTGALRPACRPARPVGMVGQLDRWVWGALRPALPCAKRLRSRPACPAPSVCEAVEALRKAFAKHEKALSCFAKWAWSTALVAMTTKSDHAENPRPVRFYT
jgi:hypothetical protein